MLLYVLKILYVEEAYTTNVYSLFALVQEQAMSYSKRFMCEAQRLLHCLAIVLFRELPPTTLAEILAPSSIMVGHKFELSVDQWKFIGHSFSIHNEKFSIAFNVVFVFEVPSQKHGCVYC